jgi:alkanesulfonate monooxygenase SsuD/methylene tetrahydromethanopterin reductase-like flavin-dependent oxidoreductase (luciferase family)
MSRVIELGVDTFGDVTLDADGNPLHHAQVLRQVVAEAVLADEVGLHFFGVGEHHRADFAISAPEVVLAAIAARTTRIRLGTAVTVLSSDDPVRVYERFSTLNALSDGRAEVIVGRGSFTESFPLFGFDTREYDLLFEERLELFAALIGERPVTWTGKTRSPLRAQQVYPPIESGRLRRGMACRSCWPSSVAIRAGSRRIPTSSTVPLPGSATRSSRWARIRQVTLPLPTRKRAKSSGLTMPG